MNYQNTPPNWKVRARIWIVIMFLLLCGADYLLVKFSYDPSISYRLPALEGLAVLSAIFSKVLLIGMWRRMSWSRYALGVLLAASIMGFAIGMFIVGGANLARPAGLLKKSLGGVALQALALVPLARSRSIRKQLHPMTGRD